jgi:hypothetical protein
LVTQDNWKTVAVHDWPQYEEYVITYRVSVCVGVSYFSGIVTEEHQSSWINALTFSIATAQGFSLISAELRAVPCITGIRVLIVRAGSERKEKDWRLYAEGVINWAEACDY